MWVDVASAQIPNFKHQIPNKSQIPIPNDRNKIWGFLNFGNWKLFVIWDLYIGIFTLRAASCLLIKWITTSCAGYL
jgi:hypothetical protein